jgi:hypothetical protein
MISRRTRLSLCQLLDLLRAERAYLSTLLEKHFLDREINWYDPDALVVIRRVILEADEERVLELLRELAQTTAETRQRVTPRYRFDERWADLGRCLALDGYHVREGELVAVDPLAAVDPPMEDELAETLRRCNIPTVDVIVDLLERSARAFTNQPPDFNACLTHARVALETFGRSLAAVRAQVAGRAVPQDRWGDAIADLRVTRFISQQEEATVTSVYTFASVGAHVPLGLTDEERARLGRLLLIGMLFFLAKRAAV